MQFWQRLKRKVKQAWGREDNRRILFVVLIGLSLLAGIGLRIFHDRPQPEEAAIVTPVSREEMERAIQAEVENVIVERYPWVADGPIRLAAVEPPSAVMPSPSEPRPLPEQNEVEEAPSFESLLWPVQGEIKTPFGWYRHPVYGDWRFNSGIEVSACGEAVRTVLDGQVVTISSNGLGTELVIEHGGGWTSTYRSITALKVVPGEQVRQNQEIARPEGETIFFGLNHDHKPVNPQAFLR